MSVEELLNDAGFAAKVDAVSDDLDAVAALFREKGIDITAEQIQAEMDKLDSDELTAENLDHVAGGIADPIIGGVVILAVYLYYKFRRR